MTSQSICICAILVQMKNQFRYVVGVDEAGRGPLAGSVAVGVVKVPIDFDWDLISGVGDSKQVSEKKRAAIFLRATQLKQSGKLDFSVVLVRATYIDKHGIVSAIKTALAKAIEELKLSPKDCFIKLDGSLQASSKFTQETIIKGDQKELVIGLASILAKVTRDSYMCKQDIKFPQYCFALHKGYGTKIHRDMIAAHGFTPLHRKTYCKNIKIQ